MGSLSDDEASILPSGAKARAEIGPLVPWSTARWARAATSQSRTVRSAPPLASVLPSGEKATNQTAAVCPSSLARGSPLATSQSVTAPSPPAVASVLPSGETAIDRNRPVGPLKVRIGRSVPNPHRLTGPPAVASRLAVGREGQRPARRSARPPAGQPHCKVAVSQSLRFSALEPTGRMARSLPSGEKARRISRALKLERMAPIPPADGVPELDAAVGRGRGKQLAIGRERQGNDLRLDARERPGRKLTGQVPQPQLVVAAAGRQRLAVGRESERRHRTEVSMNAKGLQMAVGGVPAAQRPVGRTGDEGPSVGQERQWTDRPGGRPQGDPFGALGDIPEPDRAVAAR